MKHFKCIYKNINDVWTQIGDDINGQATEDLSGFSVSLSDNGVVAIGAPKNMENGRESGHVRVFSSISNEFEATTIGTISHDIFINDRRDDYIDGLAGTDTISFTGNFLDYSFMRGTYHANR